MKISLNELNQMFDDLVKEKKLRAEVSNWAIEKRQTEDNNDLIYEPASEEDRIWRGILYLTGVDLRNIDGGYLESLEDFAAYKEKMNSSNFIKPIICP